MLPEKARLYPFTALESAPVVMSALLRGRTSGDDLWDFRPNPERFTLREVLAHVADWDNIFLERVQRILDEDQPTLPDLDEGAIALANAYAIQDPLDNLKRWSESRPELVKLLRSRKHEDFGRIGYKAPFGAISIDAWLSLIIGHDMYHLRQTSEYIAAYESGQTDLIATGWSSTALRK